MLWFNIPKHIEILKAIKIHQRNLTNPSAIIELLFINSISIVKITATSIFTANPTEVAETQQPTAFFNLLSIVKTGKAQTNPINKPLNKPVANKLV